MHTLHDRALVGTILFKYQYHESFLNFLNHFLSFSDWHGSILTRKKKIDSDYLCVCVCVCVCGFFFFQTGCRAVTFFVGDLY